MDWHGRTLNDLDHPTLPWWFFEAHTSSQGAYLLGQGGVMRRIDGLLGPECSWAALKHGRAPLGPRKMMEALTEELASLDEANPIPPPEPRARQVWAIPGLRRHEMMVTEVYPTPEGKTVVVFGGSRLALGEHPWPPVATYEDGATVPGVLIEGHGAPWAPKE